MALKVGEGVYLSGNRHGVLDMAYSVVYCQQLSEEAYRIGAKRLATGGVGSAANAF